MPQRRQAPFRRGRDESVFDCATKMNDDNVGFVPICEKDHAAGHRLIGTLTDRDIVLRVVAFEGGRDPRAVKCGEIMSKSPIFCKPEEDISRAADLMARNHISRMCVCEGNILKDGVPVLLGVHGSPPRTISSHPGRHVHGTPST